MKKTWMRLCAIVSVILCLLFAGCSGAGSSAPANVATSVGAGEAQLQITQSADAQEELQTDESQLQEDQAVASDAGQEVETEAVISEDGVYTSKDDVAEYIYEYHHLPSNFITKKEAKTLGWDNKEGNLDEVAPGKSIGGDYFGNYEGLLPEKDGRKYYECDINSDGGYRNAERIIYSNDGLIYYTGDHYKSFTLLYGEE